MDKSTLFLILAAAALPAHAQGIQAGLECRFTGTDFVYDCLVHLSRGGTPLAGAQLSIGADMPSMPMAHNIKPVKAKPGKKPGDYEARLDVGVVMCVEHAAERRERTRARRDAELHAVHVHPY